MPKLQSVAALLTVAGFTVSAALGAPAVQVLGVGSSAMFDTLAITAWYSLAGTGALHYTAKSCPAGSCGSIHDLRSGAIPSQGGELWVVWSADHSRVWAYLGADSVAGVRAFLATPRARMAVDASVTTTTSGQNLVDSILWGNDTSYLPADIFSAINNAAFTAAFTDIRPEDAKVAQVRACNALNTTNYDGLGYCAGSTSLVGEAIRSAFSTAQTDVVAFNLSGADRFTHLPVPSYTAIDMGATPLVFFYNAAGPLASLGSHDLNSSTAQQLFMGEDCNSSLFGAGSAAAITVIQNEPFSGAWTTTEADTIRLRGNGFTYSQENNVNPSSSTGNPLNQNCAAGGGKRERAVGTAEMVQSVQSTLNGLGYVLAVSEQLCRIGGNTQERYLTFGNVDPLNNVYINGGFDRCGTIIPGQHGPHDPNYFPNLRNGSYPLWSMLRAMTDSGGVNLTNTQTFVKAAQTIVDYTTYSFVPAVPVSDGSGNDPGMLFYRSHYSNPLSPAYPNNGLSGQVESGSDAGGCVERTGPAPGILNCTL